MTGKGNALGQLVEVLVDLDVVDFTQPGPWPGPPGDGDQVCDVDFDGVWADRRDDADALASSYRQDDDAWAGVAEHIERNVSGAPWTPPDILDALAWYLPVHYFGEESAIYIREDALLDVVVGIARKVPESSLRNSGVIEAICSSAFSVLFLHEMFHHKTESFAIRAEVIEQRRLYLPYMDMTSSLLNAGSDLVIEEAIACAQMINRLGEPRYSRGIPSEVKAARRQLMHEWIPTLGPSYRRGLEFVPQRAHDAGLRDLYCQVGEATTTPDRNPIHWTATPNINKGIFDIESVTKVIVPVGNEPLIPWFTPPFRGTLTDRDAVKVLVRRFGCTEVRGAGKGSHTKLRTPTGELITIPRGTQSPGVIRNTARAVGVTGQELVDLARAV